MASRLFVVTILGAVIFGSACGATSNEQSASSAKSTSLPLATTAPQLGGNEEHQNSDSAGDNSSDPPAVAAAKENAECSERSVTDVSEDYRVLVLDDGNRYLIPDEYQAITSTWEGDDVYYCDGGLGHRYFVNEDGDSVPVGALDE